jgi:plasmid maintenance system antidote protein VapI
MTPDFWMNLQLRWDLYHAQQTEQKILSRIEPRQGPGEVVSAQNVPAPGPRPPGLLHRQRVNQ